MGKTKWQEKIGKLIDAAGGPGHLADRLGVSYFTVIRWRSGAHKPSQLAQVSLGRLEKELKIA